MADFSIYTPVYQAYRGESRKIPLTYCQASKLQTNFFCDALNYKVIGS